MRAVIGFMLMIGFVGHANAQRFCSRPQDPSCVVLMMGGDKSYFEFCRFQMIDYQEKVREYVECLRGEQADITRLLNESVSRFNMCASGVTC